MKREVPISLSVVLTLPSVIISADIAFMTQQECDFAVLI